MIGEVSSSFIISHDQRFTHLSDLSLSLEQRSTFTRAKFSKIHFFKVAFILRQFVTKFTGNKIHSNDMNDYNHCHGADQY